MTPFDDKHQLLDNLIGKYQRAPSPKRTIYRKDAQFMPIMIDGKKFRMQGVLEYFGGPMPNRYTAIETTFYVPRMFLVKVRWYSSFVPLTPQDKAGDMMWRRVPIAGANGLPARFPDKMSIIDFQRFDKTSDEEIEHFLTIAALSGEVE